MDRLKQYCGSPREANSATFQHIINLEVIYMSCIIMCCTLYDVWAFVYIQAILLIVLTCGPCLLLSEVLQDKEKKAILSWRMYDISISEDVRKYLHFLLLSWLMRLLCAGVWYSTYFHNLYQINQTIFSSCWNQHFYACLPIKFLDKKEKHKFNISGSNIFLLSNIKTQKAYLKIKHF